MRENTGDAARHVSRLLRKSFDHGLRLMLSINVLVALSSIINPSGQVCLQEALAHLQILYLKWLALRKIFLSALLYYWLLAVATIDNNLDGG